MGRPVYWTKDRIMNALCDAAERWGRTPTSNEIWRGIVGPSIFAIRREFGSVRAALLAAGLTPRKPGGVVKHGLRMREGPMPVIDPAKAARITAEKRAFWMGTRRSA